MAVTNLCRNISDRSQCNLRHPVDTGVSRTRSLGLLLDRAWRRKNVLVTLVERWISIDALIRCHISSLLI
jgi:hypothetical protein